MLEFYYYIKLCETWAHKFHLILYCNIYRCTKLAQRDLLLGGGSLRRQDYKGNLILN